MGATNSLHKLILCSVLGVSFCYAQSTLIFASNYDLALTTNDAQSRAQSRVEVRNESTFPIEFQKHKIHITVSAISEDQYTITMNIYEKSLGSWFEINADDMSFGGTYSIPVEYQWSSADIHLNLAIVVSPKSSI